MQKIICSVPLHIKVIKQLNFGTKGSKNELATLMGGQAREVCLWNAGGGKIGCTTSAAEADAAAGEEGAWCCNCDERFEDFKTRLPHFAKELEKNTTFVFHKMAERNPIFANGSI